MTTQRWQQLKDALQALWEMDAGERPAFLNQIGAQDPKLRSSVEALLASDQNIGDFLAAPTIRLIGDLTGDRETENFGDCSSGRHVGPYLILREIGRGGMGTVYLAERADGEYRKRVAVKLVNPECGAEPMLRRFRHERQVLAELDHPNIARLIDGNATEDGSPYLVMEHVEGIRIDVWCDRHKPLLRDCLRLFRSVCSAVQYAHERQVIHRDIKPGNVLVTAEGVPKLLDFGIAKVLNPERFVETGETTIGHAPMTPDYASPEQLRGEPAGPASDIFALGVVLYRLLTGRLPYTVEPQEREAVKPSIAATRRDLEGDLDSIVLKALNHEPGGRYASVAELSDDLDRSLHDRPVRARKADFPYRGRKFVKRNRLTVSLSAAFVAVSILALVAAKPRPAAPNKSVAVHPVEVRPPEKPLPGPDVAAAPKTLAVVHIESLVKDASFDRINHSFRELLTSILANAQGIRVISGDRVRELVARRTQGDSRLPAGQALDVAREARADLFLSGALIQAGRRVRLEFGVQETATGRVLFDDKVEGSDPQAIFSMADQAAAAILARLVPGQAAPKALAGATLTDNLEALKAYEEGLKNRTVFRAAEAHNALRRAIDLDPQFVMAHYHLADSMRHSGNVAEARRSITRAVQLAEHAPVPRLQKMLAQALQMRLDLRLDEAAKILETAHHEFPLETDPLFQLASIRTASARFAEAATLLEKVVRMDARHALAHDQLGYQYGFLGDVARAVASIDRYAALVPPGNEVPFCSRGDVYMINERYDEALAQYGKINYAVPMAIAALHAGNYGFTESLVKRRPDSTRLLGILGDLAAGHGQLNEAVPYYERAAMNYQVQGQLRPWFALLSAARIHFEQNRPDEVLALCRRNETPWAAGLRGTAHLLLREDAEAEKEFAGLRDSIAPILGDYVARQMVEFHRMQATFYAGRFDRVIQMWPGLPRSWWSLYALDVGRAYLQSGVFTEAEHHLRLARKAQEAFYMNTDMKAQHNLLTWMLAQFYLGQVMEKTGQRTHAIAHHQSFVNHFENSSAALPQIAAARAFLAPLRLSERGRLLFSDEFSGNTLEPGWASEPGIGIWEVAGGVATASKRTGEIGLSARSRPIAYHDAIFEFSFRMEGDGRIGLSLGPSRLFLASAWMDLTSVRSDESSGLTMDTLERVNTVIERGKWHKVVVEVRGNKIIAQLDDKTTIAGENPVLDTDKTRFVLIVDTSRASFDYVRLYELGSR